MGILEVFGHFLKMLLIWTIKLGLQAYCGYFRMCVKNVWGQSGGHLNKKNGLTGYGDSHVKDKTS